MALLSGARLGGYVIVSPLGAGGMGEVYLAHDTKLNRRVAIKVLPEAHAGNPDRLARFDREAKAVAALNHPNVAAIYDLAETTPGSDGNGRFLVLEFVDGDTLAERLHRGPLSPEDALRVARQILEALEAAHEKGICHRDLKPANVKLTADGVVKVLDFGLAKLLPTSGLSADMSDSPTVHAGTMAGVILGTVGYMSPEQAKGLDADQRSDIFSFGCILFELLTGRQAFEGTTTSEILASVLKTEVDLSVLEPRLNPRLVELLRRCLAKNPRNRWHAAADVRLELDALTGQALAVDEPRIIEVVPRRAWKRVLAPLAAALIVGPVAAYLAWTLKTEPPGPVMRFSLPLPAGQQFTNPGRQLIALSPDGTNLVYVANQRLYLRSLAEFEPRVIAGGESEGAITSPVFSPDGQSVAFYSAADQKLKRVATTGGAAVTICAAENPLGMSWSGGTIVFGQVAGIMRVSANGGSPEMIAAAAARETVGSPQMLPGDRAVLFSVKTFGGWWDQAEIVAQPVGGERKTVVTGGADARLLPTGQLAYALNDTIFVVGFDPDTLTVSGDPVPVAEGVQRAINTPPSAVAQFTFSATGTLAYVPGPATIEAVEAGSDLVMIDRNGVVKPLNLPRGQHAAPRVSRDGKWIAFERSDEKESSIWVYEVGGTNAPQRLTFAGNDRAPVWSPDSAWLAFESNRDGNTGIFRQRADGSGTPERLTTPESRVVHTPQSWSSDGAYLLFAAQTSDQSALNVLTLRDRTIAAYGEVAAREAVFSPDGRWVAYQLPDPKSSNNSAVYLEPFPRTGAKFLLPVSGGHPFWSPNGNEIVLNSGPGRSTIVPVSWTPRVAFGRPRDILKRGRSDGNPVTTRRNADMMPDGETILGVQGATRAMSAVQGEAAATVNSPSITIVLNWFDEVRRRSGL